MARIARVICPGIPHHVTQRGNRRQKTFFCDDDYLAYIALMNEWCKKYDLAIWAWCLMPNANVHLVAVPQTETGLARAIGEAHRRYRGESIFVKNGGGIYGKSALSRIRWMKHICLQQLGMWK